MDLPQLPRKFVRPEPEEQKFWEPGWKCFCCQDTGRVHLHNIQLLIPDYNTWDDPVVICQMPGCDKGNKWFHLGNNNIDMRFTSLICQELDMRCRKHWKRFEEPKVIDLRAMTKKMTMPGSFTRTKSDDQEIERRKKEIEAITSEQWLAMKDEYQRGKKDETY